MPNDKFKKVEITLPKEWDFLGFQFVGGVLVLTATDGRNIKEIFVTTVPEGTAAQLNNNTYPDVALTNS